jgi:hypothetical protein
MERSSRAPVDLRPIPHRLQEPIQRRRHALDVPLVDVPVVVVPGCDDLLISLLTAVLRPAVPIVSVQYLARETEKTEPDDRGLFLDVLVRLNNGDPARGRPQDVRDGVVRGEAT